MLNVMTIKIAILKVSYSYYNKCAFIHLYQVKQILKILKRNIHIPKTLTFMISHELSQVYEKFCGNTERLPKSNTNKFLFPFL